MTKVTNRSAALSKPLERLIAWGPDQRIMELFDLADRKGYDAVKAIMRVRLIDKGGNLVKRETGSAAFSYGEALRFFELQPGRKGAA